MSSLGSFASALLFAVIAFAAGLAADRFGARATLLTLSVLGFVPFVLQLRFALTIRRASEASPLHP